MLLRGAFDLAFENEAHHPANLQSDDVGGDANHAIPAGTHDRKRLVVIPAPHLESVRRAVDHVSNLIGHAGSFLDADDVVDLREPQRCGGFHVQGGATRNVVQNPGYGNALGDGLEVAEKAFLRRFVVGGDGQQECVYADLFRLFRQLD